MYFGSCGLIAYDFEGNELWRHALPVAETNNDFGSGTSPILKRGKNRLIAVKPGGSGDITESHVAWQKTKGLPYLPSALLYRGHLFIIKDGGLASCFDAATGAAKYEQERIGVPGQFYASPVAANGHVYVVNLAGKAATLLAGNKMKVVWKTDFKARVAATPAIAGDTLYVRTETKMFAFKNAK